MMMTKVSFIIQFDEISGVLVGEENIFMTDGGSLFKFCMNSSVASPYRECPYFTWAQSNLFKGQRSSQKAAAENPSDSNTSNLSYMARRKTSKSITASTLDCALCQYFPPNQVLLYEREEEIQEFPKMRSYLPFSFTLQSATSFWPHCANLC